MKTINPGKFSMAFFIAILITFTGCEVDDRIDDLTGGYKGVFIDKYTGDTVYTEYYGAKIKLLDLEYGAAAQPLVYKALPDGTYQNTKVYPSKYKVWADGPFLSLDTIYGDIRKFKEMNLSVVPNVSLKIKKVELQVGIIANITFSYKVNDLASHNQEVGIVYGTTPYPGQLNAMAEGSNGSVFKRIKKMTDLEGEFTETLYLGVNSTYYVRALGRTAFAGDYWNYSNQAIVHTGNIDVSDIPVEAQIGTSSATSAILQWSFPKIVDQIKVSYTDKEGLLTSDIFGPDEYNYVANLPHNEKSVIRVSLIAKGKEGPEKTIEVQTKGLEAPYIAQGTIPFFNDLNMKYSISVYQANTKGAETGNIDWVNNPMNHEYMDWWNTWLNAPQNLPTCREMENIKELAVYGDIQTLVDILPCVNLEKLTIAAGSQFSTGKMISKEVNLSVLKHLKKLKTIVLGKEIPLTESLFRKAGVTQADIIVE